MEHHPDADLDNLGLQQLFEWIIDLPGFDDEPILAHDDLLTEILREWYEEIDFAIMTNHDFLKELHHPDIPVPEGMAVCRRSQPFWAHRGHDLQLGPPQLGLADGVWSGLLRD